VGVARLLRVLRGGRVVSSRYHHRSPREEIAREIEAVIESWRPLREATLREWDRLLGTGPTPVAFRIVEQVAGPPVVAPELLALVRQAAAEVPVADRLGYVPHIPVSVDAAFGSTGETWADFQAAYDLAMSSAYRHEVERQLNERLGDLVNWEPTGLLGHLPPPALSPTDGTTT
jgi:hypothetical protein